MHLGIALTLGLWYFAAIMILLNLVVAFPFVVPIALRQRLSRFEAKDGMCATEPSRLGS
jgi:hypothetical protein